MEKAINFLFFLPETFGEIETFAASVIDDVEQGETDVLRLHIQLKKIESLIEKISKDNVYKSALENELNKYPEKTFSLNGAKVTKTSRATIDYSNCQDEQFEYNLQQQKRFETLRKQREDFLKTLKAPIEIVNTETGETATILPPVVHSTDTVSITILK